MQCANLSVFLKLADNGKAKPAVNVNFQSAQTYHGWVLALCYGLVLLFIFKSNYKLNKIKTMLEPKFTKGEWIYEVRESGLRTVSCDKHVVSIFPHLTTLEKDTIANAKLMFNGNRQHFTPALRMPTLEFEPFRVCPLKCVANIF